MRDDLPIPIQRSLEWQRRSFIRSVGAMWTDLVRLGIDPTEFQLEVKGYYDRIKSEYRDAA